MRAWFAAGCGVVLVLAAMARRPTWNTGIDSSLVVECRVIVVIRAVQMEFTVTKLTDGVALAVATAATDPVPQRSIWAG